MMSLTAFGITRRRLTILVMMVILALGASSYLGFPKREDPAITVRTAVVTIINQGLPLAQIEDLIARPIEERARAIAGVDEVRTQVLQGGAIVQIDLANAVAENAIAAVFREIENEIEALAPQMPAGSLGPLVNTNFGDVAIATVAVTAQGFAMPELERVAEALRDRLYALSSVSAVTLHGVQEERIWIEVDRSRLSSIGTTLDPVIAALRAQNVRLPSGSIVSEGTRFALETTGDFADVAAIADMIVDISGVGLVRLRDLASVRRGTIEPQQTPVFHNGQQAILLGIEMFAGEDIVAVGEDLRRVVDAFVLDQPWGVEARFSTFQPGVVAESVSNALNNMLQTFLVVLGVMTLFLGLRPALVIASIVPFAVGFAFIFMPFLGIELQQVSIAAIIISLGLLVDNGLVIVEDMDRRLRGGDTRETAAIAAGRQYTLPLLIASVTTVAAFLPLFLLDGTEGQYGFSLGAVVALMLTGSFLAAVYLLPALAVWFLPDPKPHGKPGLMDRAASVYGRIVGWVVRSPYVTLTLSVAILVAAISQMPNVRQQLFPLSERPQFLVYLDLPRGSAIAATEETALRLTDLVTLLATACFTFGAGIFTVLSFVEKPIWRLMRDPMSTRVDDWIVRDIHAQLRRVIHLLPPTMMTTMAAGAVLLMLQAWLAGFSLGSVIILAHFTICLGYLLSILGQRIRAVDLTPSDSEIGTVRTGLGELAALHHVGLFTAASLALMQIIFAFLN